MILFLMQVFSKSFLFSDQSSLKNEQNTTSSICHTEKVLQDPQSGVMLKNITNFKDVNSSVKTPSSFVMMKSVVAYLGTVEIECNGNSSIAENSFTAVQQCVDALRLEQHIHQRVVMIVGTIYIYY